MKLAICDLSSLASFKRMLGYNKSLANRNGLLHIQRLVSILSKQKMIPKHSLALAFDPSNKKDNKKGVKNNKIDFKRNTHFRHT